MKWRILSLILLIITIPTAVLCQESDVVSNTVRIKIGNSYGSGAYIGDRLVLSCAHLFTGEPTTVGEVWFPDGKRFTAEMQAVDRAWDQSVLELNEVPDKCGIPVSYTNPAIGDVVNVYGYGRGNTVMATTGLVQKYASNSKTGKKDWFEITGAAEEGSSGGPIVNARGEVIGNLFASDDKITVGLMAGRTHQFLAPWRNRIRKPGSQCQGGVCPIRQGQPPSVLVPLPQTPTVPQPPIIIPPPPTDIPSVNYQKIVDLLKQDEEFLSKVKGKDGVDGLPGTDGVAGQPGAKGDVGKSGEVTADQISAMTAAIIQFLKTDSDFIAATTGPAGEPGLAGKDGQTGPTPDIPPVENGWSHMVLIAPKTSDYWARLSGEFDKATSHYSMIRHIEPPTDRNIGPMPVLVAYNGGKPAKSWIGLRDVSQAFTNIVRGDYDEFVVSVDDK